jgi:concentrative nucleoside transporter, CNT family
MAEEKQNHGVVSNPDPALDVAKEHHHQHLHHDAFAEKGRHDDAVYTQGTTSEPSIIPNADPLDDNLHRRGHPERKLADTKEAMDVNDAEKGAYSPEPEEEKEHGHGAKVRRFYQKYRIFFRMPQSTQANFLFGHLQTDFSLQICSFSFCLPAGGSLDWSCTDMT